VVLAYTKTRVFPSLIWPKLYIQMGRVLHEGGVNPAHTCDVNSHLVKHPKYDARAVASRIA
jgi:hypothetical protein